MTDEVFDSMDAVYDRMTEGARMHYVDKDLLEITTPEALEKARETLNRVIGEGIVSQRELAHRSNVRPTAVSTCLSGKWVGKQGTLYTTATTLCRALDVLIAEREAQATAIEGYVETRFALEVRGLALYVRRRKMMGAFVAPAGAGKSTVLDVLREETPGAVLVTGKKTRSGVKGFLQAFARELGILEQGRAEDLQDRIVTRLRGSGRLVLVDEAHKLQVATLDVLREIWDETKVPMLFAGTPSFYTVLTTRRVGRQAAELMDQLSSRVGIFRDLTALENPETGEPDRLYTPDDIRKVFNRGKVRLAKDAIDFLCKIANTIGGGGLRTAAHLTQVAIDLWPDETVCAQHLERAFVTKVGAREAAYRMDQAAVRVRQAAVAG